MAEVKKSSYIPPNMTSLLNHWSEGEPGGETCRIEALSKIFAWQRGFVGAWYGWANDGKGTFTDYMMVTKSIFDGWKWCLYKPEDMSSYKNSDNKIEINADNIYKKLLWTYTGKCPFKKVAERFGIPQIEMDEYMDAMEWIRDHFYVIHPQDRRIEAILAEMDDIYQVYGVDGYWIDPWAGVIKPKGDRDDEVMNEVFIRTKNFAMERNGVFNYIAHPKSITDVRQGKAHDSPYKVVDQYLVAGGAAWDNKMDFQMSVYRQERHLNKADPRATLFNLKQRESEIVGAERGEFEKIIFDKKKRRFYFDGLCPIEGKWVSQTKMSEQQEMFEQQLRREAAEKKKNQNPNDAPF